MPPIRVKVPEYPRPVSPVCVDEIPICADTIVYHDGGSNQDRDTEERAAKRRRIGAYATSYLRGEALYISTAQLKGPFKDGWQNPWARRKAVEVESDRAATSPLQEDIKHKQPESRGCSMSARAYPMQTKISLEQESSQQPVKRAESLDEIRFWRKKDRDLPRSIEEEHGKTRQVEDWLRRNSSYDQPEHQMPPQQSFSSMSSPTYKYSQKRGRTKKWEASPIHIEFPPVADAVVDMLTSKHVGDLSMAAHDRYTQQLPPAREPQHLPRLSEVLPNTDLEGQDRFHLPHDMDEPVKGGRVKDDGDMQVCRQAPSAAADVTELKTSHIVDDTSPQPDNQLLPLHPTSVDHVELEQRPRVLTEECHQQLESNLTSASLHTAPERSTVNQHDSGPPSLSGEASRASILHTLPSAQVQMQPTLNLAPSYLSSNGLLLQEHSDQPVLDLGLKNDDHSTTKVAQENAVCSADQPAPFRNEPVTVAAVDEAEPPRVAEPAINNEEQVLRNDPSLASPVKAPSTKCPTAKSDKDSSPKKLLKRKKRAAFNTDEASSGSSQGSIKMAMKVAKPSILNQDRVKGLKIDLAADTGADAEEHLLQSSPVHRGGFSKLLQGSSCPKGILRSTLTNSAAPMLSTAHDTSASMKQDAQRPMKLSEIENGHESLREDDFDPDAVMDDLGSFLRTWDSEKEAAGL
ncbi:hypothetical protein EDD36DRAFT_448706 [Exophiala viscosa]|uniref:Protamine P1 n=1 Tax=Exophiala viscosa TaxID=2486360 RepID=A0AAN6I9X3_9EURO|nr:hypothetical protein EDD36DRAFT_448706 [Exophiala viscosa]